MNREFKLLDSINDIDDKFIEESNPEQSAKTVTVHPGRKRWIAIAACMVIVLAALVPTLGSMFDKSGVDTYVSAEKQIGEPLEEKSDGKKAETNGAYSLNSNVPGNADFFGVYKTLSNESKNENDIGAVVVDCNFFDPTPWVKVCWSNSSDEDKVISPKFALVRIGEYDSLESITTGEPIFEEVLYTIPAKGELEMFYRIDRGIYDISKPGHYRIYLDTAEITEYNLDGNYFDFQLD